MHQQPHRRPYSIRRPACTGSTAWCCPAALSATSTWLTAGSPFEPVDGAETLIEDVFLLPGLVDAHAHLSLYSPAGDDAPAAVRVRASAREHLAAGVLAIREPGSPDHESVGLGAHEGLPRTVTGGRFLAPPGMYFPGLAREVEPDGLPDAAVEEYHVSGSWAKIIGDTPIGDDLRRTYDDQSLAEAVRQVHEAGGRVAIHCVLAETVHAAVEAGVDSLEHGSFLQSDQVAEVARRGIAWVPTRAIDATVRQLIRDLGYTADRVRHVEERLDRQGESLRAAVDAGVMVLAGTDAGMVPHGLIVREVELPPSRRDSAGRRDRRRIMDGAVLARSPRYRGGRTRRPRGLPRGPARVGRYVGPAGAGHPGRPCREQLDRPTVTTPNRPGRDPVGTREPSHGRRSRCLLRGPGPRRQTAFDHGRRAAGLPDGGAVGWWQPQRPA